MTRSPSISRPGIDLGWDPVARTRALPAVSSPVPSTWTVRGPVTRPRPRTMAMPSFFRWPSRPLTFLVTMSSRLATVAE